MSRGLLLSISRDILLKSDATMAHQGFVSILLDCEQWFSWIVVDFRCGAGRFSYIHVAGLV
jgi:hypothetical protein